MTTYIPDPAFLNRQSISSPHAAHHEAIRPERAGGRNTALSKRARRVGVVACASP
jgi:hypothetical protein